MKRLFPTLIGLAIGLASTFAAAEPPAQKFKVLGTWRLGSMYPDFEEKLFTEHVPKASNGRLTADVKAMTDVGLKGFETVKLLNTGVYDIAFGGYVYIASGNPVFEGIDLALVPNSVAQARQIADAYWPVVEKAMAEIHGVQLLASYPFPAQVLACREKFTSLAELQRRKIRVYSTTLGDMAEGLGGTSVTIPLAEVVPALQRGVIDCGITSAISMYNAKWQDVVKYVYETPVSAGIAFLAMNKKKWEALDPETRRILGEQAKAFETRTWDAIAKMQVDGIACLTGKNGKCSLGAAADMTLVSATAADDAVRRKVLGGHVLQRYAKRCGAACADQWNATAGRIVGVEARP